MLRDYGEFGGRNGACSSARIGAASPCSAAAGSPSTGRAGAVLTAAERTAGGR